MSSAAVSVKVLSEHNATSYDKERVVQILLAALRGDLQISAMTGGQAALEPAFFRSQLDLCLKQGEVYIAGRGGSFDGVLLVYDPSYDCYDNSSSREFVAKLSPEMQQWWTSYFRPKYAEMTNAALGNNGMRKTVRKVLSIAVHPEVQHRGICRRLLESVLNKADTERQRISVDVNNNVLVGIFSKFGFWVRVTKNFGSYQGGFPLFSMLREPAL
ncbi:hypothetical protein M0805_005489 [Coniferiporia weirii]|nr:hypothetical protein M0805_005489 [Coniferiporia weirii]